MSLKTFIVKWEAQLKALNPKYDVHYEVSKDEPIVFKDSENVKLSFATIADTHLIDNEASEKYLANVFEDIGNSKEKFDAFLMAGDIAEYGWAVDSITELYEKNIISGRDEKTFAPGERVLREEFVKMIVEAFAVEGKADVK